MDLDMNAHSDAPAQRFWDRVEALFNDALELDPLERARLLDDRCGADPSVRAEVQSLLDAHARAAAFMPLRAGSPAVEPPIPAGLREGDLVGAFRLVKRIASGGMGTVFLAERAEGGFAQSVAIKVIAAPLVTDQAARRFRTER